MFQFPTRSAPIGLSVLDLYSLVLSNCRCCRLLRALQVHQWRRLAKCMVIWGWRPLCEDTQDEGALLDPFAGRRVQR